jgi:hypothetical protein
LGEVVGALKLQLTLLLLVGHVLSRFAGNLTSRDRGVVVEDQWEVTDVLRLSWAMLDWKGCFLALLVLEEDESHEEALVYPLG